MRLVVWDVDGTLVDSQAHIVHAMAHGLAAAGLPPLPRERVLSIVGLSLPVAIAALLPDADAATRAAVEAGYRDGYHARRVAGESPLFPGAREVLDHLAARDDVLMAVATGKSRRGLDALIPAHGLAGMFVAAECADGHPSKPAPDMLLACVDRAGLSPRDTVMVGDTSFDMDMARAAGTAGFGVGWGYHAPARLLASGARGVAGDFAALAGMIEEFTR